MQVSGILLEGCWNRFSTVELLQCMEAIQKCNEEALAAHINAMQKRNEEAIVALHQQHEVNCTCYGQEL